MAKASKPPQTAPKPPAPRWPPPAAGEPAWGTPHDSPPSKEREWLGVYFAHRYWLWLKANDQVLVYSLLSRADGDKILLARILEQGDAAGLEYVRQRRANRSHGEADKLVVEQVIAHQAGGETPDPLPGNLRRDLDKLVKAFEAGEGRIVVEKQG